VLLYRNSNFKNIYLWERKMKEEKKTVICITCTKEVKVKLIPFGSGHVASCPVCKKLAYNGK